MADDVMQNGLDKTALIGEDKSVLTIEAVDEAIERMKPFSPNNPYVLPPRLTWCMYSLFQQAWFETDLQSGIGVLPEEN